MKKITSIEIQNSEFFNNDFQFNFSENLNCIMGGRGTGKSTLLHFIKACLEPNAEDDKNTFNVLRNNLGSGIIKLFIQGDNNEEYRIEKSFGEEAQPYLISSGRHIPLENVNKDLLCDIFPAQMIEEIGRNSEARLELIDRMLITEVEELKRNIELVQLDLEKNAREIRAENIKLKRSNEQLLDYGSAEEDLKIHKEETPEDIKEEESKEFEKEDAAEKIRGAEKRFFKNLSEHLIRHLEMYSEVTDDLNSTKSLVKNTDRFINKKIIDPLSKEIDTILSSIISDNLIISDKIKGASLLVTNASEKLKILHEEQHNEFVKLKQKLEKHKVFYDKLNALSKKVDEKNVRLKEIEEIMTRRKKLKSLRENGVLKLNSLKKAILEKRVFKIDELNKLFDGRIKITLTQGGITNNYEEALRNALKGNNMRYNIIIPYIIENLSPDRFAKIIHENNAEKLKDISSIDIERSKAILVALHETEAIYNIETIYCQDLPDFHLKIDKEELPAIKSKEFYKKSDELSTGQRCTTVLPIVFAISQNPLLIDQPEDNLDNKYISDTIHKIIKEQKKERQLVFITHNANIPVLSEAEKNLFLRYDDGKSSISDQGNVEEVKNSILNLLEGGEEAFKERMKLYDY